ncbi:hypothetical protein XA68_15854 [Ophiocordyceps unilateralis]|uniref:Uncharacterized protein n=1 Tax=Ophiocordyceps unilateralis TaxID=268505 RepID=A0A2A9P602_OPHUN|nr:hypothetical protein XA68_15854 [Ophiocordyceps unilateralis]
MNPEWVEFYVHCNPPLTPRGVNFVVSSVAQTFSEDDIEILYEPEIPWFKLLSPPRCKQTASAVVRDLLISIVEGETDLVDLDQYFNHETPIDVKIVKPNARVIPWSAHQARSREDDSPSDLCFPDFMRLKPHKRLWRGLEAAQGWNVDLFLKRLELRWKDFGAPESYEQLQELLRCTISWNLRGDLLYLGSSLREEVEKATKTLDNLLTTAFHDWRSEHLIVTEEPGTYRFCYRYLANDGQYQTTYLLEKVADDFDPLLEAVTVRAESRDEDGQWNRVGTNAPPKKAGMKPGTMKVFSPFDNYVYGRKEPSSVSSHFQRIADAHQAPVDQYSSKRNVESWRDAVQQAQPEGVEPDQVEESYRPHSPAEPLIDCSVENHVHISGRASDMLAENFGGSGWGLNTPQAWGETSQAVDDAGELDDLICLDPTPQAGDFAADRHLLDIDEQLDELPGLDVGQVPESDGVPCILDEDVPPMVSYALPLLNKITDTPTGKPTGRRPRHEAPVAVNGCSARGVQKSHLLKMAEARVKGLVGVLACTQGVVSIELKFGRFYRKNLGSNQIDSGNRHGPYCDDVSLMCKSLSLVDWQTDFGFSTALSACGPDLDDLVQMRPPAEHPWRLYETKAWYELVCTLNRGAEAQMVVVEIDAETFEYRCLGVEELTGCLYLHCVQRPWDMQVCISRRASFHNSPVHMAVARALAASLSVTTSRDGRLCMETTDDAKLSATVDSINVRHVARYRQGGDSNSLLSVTMVRKLDKGEKQETRRQWHTSPARSPHNGTPIIWYEASVSSLKAQDMFAENYDMALGSRATWDGDELEAEGVLEDICRPGFGIITQMDDIGSLNDNGLRMGTQNSRRTTAVEEGRSRKDYQYW